MGYRFRTGGDGVEDGPSLAEVVPGGGWNRMITLPL
jgi:hypothetical protein